MNREKGTLADAKQQYKTTHTSVIESFRFTTIYSVLGAGGYYLSTLADKELQPVFKAGSYLCLTLAALNIPSLLCNLASHYTSCKNLRETQRDISILERQLHEADKTPSREL
ncbi:MAG: hypothetical protein AABY01_04730 [Nanoarchaeota archaeon]